MDVLIAFGVGAILMSAAYLLFTLTHTKEIP